MVSIEKQIAEKELLLLQRRLESHYSLMMKFIRTQAEPTIFFLPTKHNKETEAKLEDTRGAIKKKIASLKTHLQPLLRQLLLLLLREPLQRLRCPKITMTQMTTRHPY